MRILLCAPINVKKGLVESFTQNGHVICYESKKLKKHEINYATHELGLEAIVDELKMWRNCLIGRKFELMIDHSSLKYFFKYPMLNSKKIR